jgi:tetraprenyl-beta-curcumene synthase
VRAPAASPYEAFSAGPGEARRPPTAPAPLDARALFPRKPARGALEPARLACAFAATVSGYLLTVLPRVRRELAHWQAQALGIPDPVLRRLALEALAKRGNMEGAALFAVLAPRGRRATAIRALVAFQAAYNYLDMLAEQPNRDPVSNGYQLHQALLVALDRDEPQPDYYAGYPQRADGGYLAAMVDACRTSLSALPSHAAVRDDAWAAAARIVAFQSLNLTEAQGGHELLERWAREQTLAGTELDWWQTAASCGSSLTVHALIAMSATARLDAGEAIALNDAYFPWIGALHSLLDSLVDVAEDRRHGQRNLLGHGSPAELPIRMRRLAARARKAARALPNGHRHTVILTAMVGYYLSAEEASAAQARPLAAAVEAATGPLLTPVLLLVRLRRAWLEQALARCR